MNNINNNKNYIDRHEMCDNITCNQFYPSGDHLIEKDCIIGIDGYIFPAKIIWKVRIKQQIHFFN